MKIWELIKDLDTSPGDVENQVRVLLPSGEVYDVVGLEYEPDNQHGDVMWIRTELHE